MTIETNYAESSIDLHCKLYSQLEFNRTKFYEEIV